MNVCGIVVEYNPFHNGHIHHIHQARKQSGCDLLIAVMSPHFVQRGEPAIADKWSRARTALHHGVDLVLELPTIHAVQSAQFFASAAIDILALAGADTIAFGSESNDLDRLRRMADDLSGFQPEKGRMSTVRQYAQQAGPMSPNDILGLCYIQAARRHGLHICTIQRTNDYHDTIIRGPIASATAIRSHFLRGEEISAYTPMQDAMNKERTMEKLYPYLQTRLLLDDPAAMKKCLLMDEGIEHLLKQAAREETYAAFLDRCTSARCTASRIRRTLIHYLLQTDRAQADAHRRITQLRPLAFNERARALLKTLRQHDVQVVSRFADLPAFYRDSELKAAALYTYADVQARKALMQREVEAPIYEDHAH